MSSEKRNLIGGAAFLVSLVLFVVPVSAGIVIPGDPGYSGIASYGNNFHFTPFTPAAQLSNSYAFSRNAITAYNSDATSGIPGLMYGYALPGSLPQTGSLFSQAMANYYTNPQPLTNPTPADFVVPGISDADTYYYAIPGCSGSGY
ncbi:MAG TPA: hypothetical protein VMS89_03055 [Methanoregulaceae archaeon]|nr:hypothetical protein [Methanoregulaceae archaeon]